MQLIRIRNLPRAARRPVVVGPRFPRGIELGLLRVKGVSVKVLGGPGGRVGGDGVGDEDCVAGAVDVGVDAQAEEVLVVVGVDARVDLGAPAFCVFAWVEGVGV